LIPDYLISRTSVYINSPDQKSIFLIRRNDMKLLILSCVFAALPTLALAQGSSAVEAFNQDPAVIAQKEQVVADGARLDKASAALLSGGCGFAGCSSTYLVTVGYSSKGSNPRTAVIAAFVTTSTYNAPQVELTSIDGLLR
jgi:hypothetical protein